MAEKILKFIEVTLATLGFVASAIVIYVMDHPSINDFYTCLTSVCSPDKAQNFFRIFVVIISFMVLSSLLIIIERTSQNSKNLKSVDRSYSIITNMVSGISILDKSERDDFYRRAISDIRAANGDSIIRATSSFTPPDESMRGEYFNELASLLTVEHPPLYKLLLAKGNHEEWDKACKDELNIRIRSLKAAAKKNSRPFDPNNFQVRRSRFHARMDYLIVEGSIFISIKTSSEKTNDRGYIYIKDRKIAQIFEHWFDTIFSHSLGYSTGIPISPEGIFDLNRPKQDAIKEAV